MPTVATCDGCGKRLNVKDELIGKRLKCPQCGVTFVAGGGPKPVPAAPAGPPQRNVRVEKSSGVAINWGSIVKLGLLAVIPLAILAVIFGPMRVKRKWEAIHADADKTATLVLEQAIRAHASQAGEWNPNKSRSKPPDVNEVIFYPQMFAFSLPEKIRFTGSATTATFEGYYNLTDNSIESTVKTGAMTVGGMTISEDGIDMGGGVKGSGPIKMPLPIQRTSKTVLNVTGRLSDGKADAFIEGRKAEIYYPPRSEDDE
jgi:hypothetical protein